ncbi:OmpA family protein [Novosphingobium sp. FSY-8]|uniref:OmpA family protein n=1 Tax=Novosphingobium ovatum TaxID=1908523 RepID=A0ABW9XFY8_9SPHN|nr:OmpA family protein [Novosphingobium ovatum]NBC37462.1 OmpA family protein [Novosphingobium ovatum]
MTTQRAATHRARVLAVVVASAVLASGAGTAAAMRWRAPAMIAQLQEQTQAALVTVGGRGVVARFTDAAGQATRHPLLLGGAGLSNARRVAVAGAVAAVPGMGGVHWAPRAGVVAAENADPLRACQAQVEGLLKTRSIRFAEASAAIDPGSHGLIAEVANGLRPCGGAIIAVIGHTDAKGDEAANLTLSRERALAVRNALGRQGIDLAQIRAKGLGSARPVPGLAADDPANRRIEFALIAPVSPQPTVIDTPDPAGSPDSPGQSMPLWLEIAVLLGLTYGLGISIGYGVWGGRLRAGEQVSAQD